MRLVVALLLTSVVPALAAAPNLVLILADDLGWSDLGSYGNRFINTPYIDSLARDGLRFTDAYAAAPVCAPTRAAIFTGRAPARIGMTMITRPHKRPWAKLTPPPNAYAVPLELPILADRLAGAGFVSTLIGKWHHGYGVNPHASDRVVMPPGTGSKRPAITLGFVRPPSGLPQGDSPAETFARTNPGKNLGRQTLQAVRFLEENRAARFFLMLSYNAVHIPMEGRADLVAKYSRHPARKTAAIDPRYAAMTEAMDASVGLILDTLDRLGLREDTVVVFTSDNGGLIRVYHGDGPNVTTNAPLRSEKGSLYEGGIRVPLIVRAPGLAEPNSVSDEPVITTDLYPTFLDLAGIADSESDSDGRSLRLVLTGDSLERDALYWHYPTYHHSTPSAAVRRGRWKLIEFFEDGRRELYDLQQDIGEKRDLSAARPGVVNKLTRLLHDWFSRANVQMPIANPHYDQSREALWGVRPEFPWQPSPREELQINRVE